MRIGSFRGKIADSFGSVTQLLIWMNVGAFLIQLGGSAFRVNWFEQWFALSVAGIRRGFLWQPLTYMFLHSGIWHLLVNLLVLWFFGREVEFFLGARRFGILYCGGGLVGAALWLAFNFQSPAVLVGASAAVLACVIAFATMFPEREVTLLLFFILPVRIRAKHLAWIAIALDAVPLLEGSGGRIAHLAHLGGAAFGWLYVKALGYGKPWTFRWIRWREPSAQDSEEYIRREIDPILDKISKHGMQSLTARERKILESARERLQASRW